MAFRSVGSVLRHVLSAVAGCAAVAGFIYLVLLAEQNRNREFTSRGSTPMASEPDRLRKPAPSSSAAAGNAGAGGSAGSGVGGGSASKADAARASSKGDAVRTDAPRVVKRPTVLDTRFFKNESNDSDVPRVIDQYIGKVRKPSRMVGRMEEIIKGDADALSESATLHVGAVTVRQSGQADSMVEVSVPLADAAVSAADLMVDIKSASGQRQAVVISPSDTSDSTALKFRIQKRHVPEAGAKLNVYQMGSTLPLLVSGDVDLE